jgi:membrane protease YdiL (CAAX protease family)
MTDGPDSTPRAIPAVALLHQEGVIGVIAVVGLSVRSEGLVGGLAPRGPAGTGLLIGVIVGILCAATFVALRRLPALADLEQWQRRMVGGWTITDVAAVSVFSGLAEEALIRALLQPVIGLIPAALLFAALHFVPDRRLWLWPILALVLGLGLGLIFQYWGYPAAAAAHIVINAFALLRLQRTAEE